MNRGVPIAAVALAAALSLTACGSDEPETTPTSAGSTPTASAPSSTPTEAAPAGVEVDVTIADGKVTPRGERVEVQAGQQVTLRVTSDVADEIHVHADPEESLDVAAGDEGKELTFTLDRPGQYAVESHHLDATIVQLVVR